MPSASTISGYTYANWGPVTTTFTAPTSCASIPNEIEVGPSASSGSIHPNFQYGVQCERVRSRECYPSATVEMTTTLDLSPTGLFKAQYYSPGLYCPADWVTVGVASWDGDGSLITSGVLVPTTTAEVLQRDGELFLSILDKSETAVVCCPRSYSADLKYQCWSTISDYKPSSGCNFKVPEGVFGESPIKTTINGTATTRYLQTLAGTSPFIGPSTTTFDAEEKKTMVGMAVEPMLTLIHKKADFDGM
ncbi:hypothetical protein N7481_003087 [Penicillium waksmanii]|uniref:uncharacterized protein n=1 Tax=Penicillium waksmanii TaxID=69791 RepID=UPI002548C86A|nr:uncharacterized protein N7481_003087 [Penicillium waksmanii]KAJ5987877.1 hypothetical protein N7481_003087 [Penicillium waksmanii]